MAGNRPEAAGWAPDGRGTDYILLALPRGADMSNSPGAQRGKGYRALHRRPSSWDGIFCAWVAAGAAHAAEAITFLEDTSLARVLASHTTGSCVPG